MEEDWVDNSAARFLGDDSPVPSDYDSPLERYNTDPRALDPKAKADIAEYFRQMRLKQAEGGAAEASAIMSPHLIPDTQRRSENVLRQPPWMRKEMPDYIEVSPEAVNEEHSDTIAMRHDIRDNPHSVEYLKDIMDIMYGGGHVTAMDARKHPFLNYKTLQQTPMAQQAGIAALNNMMKVQAAKKVKPRMPEDVYRQLAMIQHGDYDAGLYLAKRMIHERANPRRNPLSDTGGMP